jgi:hypothetical protein
MVCLGNICINTLHKGDNNDDDDDNDNNNNSSNNNNNNNSNNNNKSIHASPLIDKQSSQT